MLSAVADKYNFEYFPCVMNHFDDGWITVEYIGILSQLLTLSGPDIKSGPSS